MLKPILALAVTLALASGTTAVAAPKHAAKHPVPRDVHNRNLPRDANRNGPRDAYNQTSVNPAAQQQLFDRVTGAGY